MVVAPAARAGGAARSRRPATRLGCQSDRPIHCREARGQGACAESTRRSTDTLPADELRHHRPAAFEGVKHGRRVVATKEQREQREAAAQSLDEEKKTLVASAFAVYTAIATAFFSSLISFLEPCPLGAIAKVCCEFSHVGASFPTCTCLRQDKILSPQDIQASDPRLVPSQVFSNCGCTFSHVGASFPTCTCLRQDEILSPQEILESDPQAVPNWRR